MRREVADELRQSSAVDRGGEVADPRRGAESRPSGQRGVSQAPDCPRTVLSVGTASAQGRARSIAQREARAQASQSRRATQGRSDAPSHRGRRAQRRNTPAQKGAVAVTPHGRYAAAEKQLLLETIQQTQAVSDASLTSVLHQLGISSATYYRWTARAENGRLVDDPTRHARVSV